MRIFMCGLTGGLCLIAGVLSLVYGHDFFGVAGVVVGAALYDLFLDSL